MKKNPPPGISSVRVTKAQPQRAKMITQASMTGLFSDMIGRVIEATTIEIILLTEEAREATAGVMAIETDRGIIETEQEGEEADTMAEEAMAETGLHRTSEVATTTMEEIGQTTRGSITITIEINLQVEATGTVIKVAIETDLPTIKMPTDKEGGMAPIITETIPHTEEVNIATVMQEEEEATITKDPPRAVIKTNGRSPHPILVRERVLHLLRQITCLLNSLKRKRYFSLSANTAV